MEHILNYFGAMPQEMQQQFEVMLRLYPEWNEKINVISRRDIDNLEVNHILHSLSIAHFADFAPCSHVMDLGTGGGFPALPLAVAYPDVTFHLVDRIGKKLRVAQDIAQQAGINNVTFQHGDVREVKGTFDFVISRAVMPLPDMVPLVKRLIDKEQRNSIPNGLICLKGGDLTEELRPYARKVTVVDLSDFLQEPYFKTKKLVFLPL